MSYKRGKSRPVGFNKKRQELLKCYFSISVIPMLSQTEVLINVDESSFSRTMITMYSWSKKGEDSELAKIWFSNSTSLITAISSSQKIFAIGTKGSVNSSLFLKYLKSLGKFIKVEWNVFIDRALIILYNVATHRSKKIIAFMKNWGWRLDFIPPYMPEMAPIEKYFGRLKKLVLRKTVNTKMNRQLTEADDMLK